MTWTPPSAVGLATVTGARPRPPADQTYEDRRRIADAALARYRSRIVDAVVTTIEQEGVCTPTDVAMLYDLKPDSVARRCADLALGGWLREVAREPGLNGGDGAGRVWYALADPGHDGRPDGIIRMWVDRRTEFCVATLVSVGRCRAARAEELIAAALADGRIQPVPDRPGYWRAP